MLYFCSLSLLIILEHWLKEIYFYSIALLFTSLFVLLASVYEYTHSLLNNSLLYCLRLYTMQVEYWYLFLCFKNRLPQCKNHIDIGIPITRLPCGTIALSPSTMMFTQQLIQLTLQVHAFFGVQVVFHSLELLQTSITDKDCGTVGVILISQGMVRWSSCYLLTTEIIETINNVMLVKILQPVRIKWMMARFQTVYENSLIWNDLANTGLMEFYNGQYSEVIFNEVDPGRLLAETQRQRFLDVSKFSQISDAIEYTYQFTYRSGINSMSSYGNILFESIPFGICYFALRYGEPGKEIYPGLEFYASGYTRKQIPYVDNMTNKFTYATIRLSSFHVTWEMTFIINEHLVETEGFSCSIQNLPWIPIRKPTLVTLSLTLNAIGEYYRQYFNAKPGYFIRVRIIQLINMPCHTWGLNIYAHSNSSDCLSYSSSSKLCKYYPLANYEHIFPHRYIVLETYQLSDIKPINSSIKLQLTATRCKTIYICSLVYNRLAEEEYVGYFNKFPVIRLFHHKYCPIVVSYKSCIWYAIPLLVFKHPRIQHCAIHFIFPNHEPCNCQIYSNIPYKKAELHSFSVQLYRHIGDTPIQIPHGEFSSNLTVVESLYLIWSGNCFHAVFKIKFDIENKTILKPPLGSTVMTLSISSFTRQIYFQFKSVLLFQYFTSQRFARIREEFWLQHFSWSDVQLMCILKDQIPHVKFEISHNCEKDGIDLTIYWDMVVSVNWKQFAKNFTIDYFGKTTTMLASLRMKHHASCQMLFSQREVFVDATSFHHTLTSELRWKRVCPHNFTNLDDVCLLLLDSLQSGSWNTYQTLCQMVHGDLVSISTPKKSSIVKSFIQMTGLRRNQGIQYAPVFIGLKRKYNKKVDFFC